MLFIKALLFLSAGNVVHMMHGNTEMGKMGGLSKVFPYTQWLFLIGVLALSGVPPLAAFFSKDLILEVESHAGYHTLFYVGLVASILTAFYLTRAYCLTFAGSFRADSKVLATLKEAPWIMVMPVAILAFLAIIGGFFGFSFSGEPLLKGFLSSEIHLSADEQILTKPQALLSFATLLAFVGGVGAIAAAVLIYVKYGLRFLQVSPMLKQAFYIDKIYDTLFVVPLKSVARVVNSLCEPYIFDGSVQAAVKATQQGSRLLQRVQGGLIRSYVAWMVLGAVFIVVYFVFLRMIHVCFDVAVYRAFNRFMRFVMLMASA